jgi:hypothetical protein
MEADISILRKTGHFDFALTRVGLEDMTGKNTEIALEPVPTGLVVRRDGARSAKSPEARPDERGHRRCLARD